MITKNQKIVLIDGYAQIYRAFYGIRNLTNSKNEPSNALFGMARFLLKLDETAAYKHEFAAFVLDKGKSSKRLAIHPDYKGTRKPMPDELRSQIPWIREWVEASGIPIIEKQGIEADDLIGAIATNYLENSILIFSADKDLAQLVNDNTFLMTPGKKGEAIRMDYDLVVNKFGVTPKQVVDYLSLVGDSADNIPGVVGVGAKTAAKLLQEYGNIEGIYANLEKITRKKMYASLAASHQLLVKNKKLISLDLTMLDNWNGLKTIERKQPNWEKLMNIATNHNLQTILKSITENRQRNRNPTLFDF